jgi:hypothetical protein
MKTLERSERFVRRNMEGFHRYGQKTTTTAIYEMRSIAMRDSLEENEDVKRKILQENAELRESSETVRPRPCGIKVNEIRSKSAREERSVNGEGDREGRSGKTF